MNRQTLRQHYFIPGEIESIERCKALYRETLGDKAGGIIKQLDAAIKELQAKHEETQAFIESIESEEIREIIELRYKDREAWETVFLKVYPGAYSASPAQYCKKALDRYLQKREDKKNMPKKDEIMNVTETFFPDDPIEEAPAEATTPTKAKRKILTTLPERKSARMQLLIRPSSKEALKVIAASRGQSVNDLINELLEAFIDAEEAKAERK